MRNLKKILCLALVLCMVLAVVSGAAYTDYADAAEITKANEDYVLAAQLLQDIGVVVGIENLEDGKLYYAPDQLLTRAELARILYVLHSGNVDGSVFETGAIFEHLTTTFTDVKGHWAENYIKYGQNAGYLNGKSAAIFDPDANVKAQEMATALLIVIGYKAADLAANYPVNVVKYGYATEGNLFTTGLSSAYQSEATGTHVVGLGAGLGYAERDVEKELYLGSDVTREEAFYMMYKAITQRSMVSKKAEHINADGEYYYDLNELFVNEKFDIGFSQEPVKGVVSGTSDWDIVGGKTTEAGTVRLETAKGVTSVWNDFGFSPVVVADKKAEIGIGFNFVATDWNKYICREVDGIATTWNGKTVLNHYAFDFAPTGTTYMAGVDVKIDKSWEVTAKDGKIVVKHYDADGKEIKDDTKTYELYFEDRVLLICNNGDTSAKTAAEFVAAVTNKINSKDEIVLKVIDGKLYAAFETKNVFGQVTAIASGKATLKLHDGTTVTGATINLPAADGALAVGDRVFGYLDAKTSKYEMKKVKATTEYFTVVLDNDGTATKYYKEAIEAANEIKLGNAFNGTTYVSYTAPFQPNQPAYWDLYIVNGFCYEAVKTDKVASLDAKVTAKSVVTNTIDGKVIYTFALEDANKVAYTFTYTATKDAEIELYDSIAKDDTVVYYYDAKTKAAIGIKEYKVLTVADTLYKAEAAFENVDTTASRVSDVLAKIDEATDAKIQYRIALKASGNKAYDKPVVIGSSATDAVPAAIAAKTGFDIVMPEYTYVQK